MNKMKVLFSAVALAVSASIFTSCVEDLPTPPTITYKTTAGYTSKDTTVEVGSSIKVGMLVEAAAERTLKSFKFEVETGGATLTIDEKSTLTGTSLDYDKTLTIGTTVGEETWRFIAVDDKSNTVTKSFKITRKLTPVANVNTYTQVLLGSQFNTTLGSFLEVTTGTVLTQANAKAASATADLIDDAEFVYYYGLANGPTIAATSNADAGTVYTNANTGLQTWTKKDATTFVNTTLTPTEFDAITLVNDVKLTDSTHADSDQKQLAAGRVFAFKTIAGKKGLVKVQAVTGARTDANGTITITVKVQ
jgi:hypothetical protein